MTNKTNDTNFIALLTLGDMRLLNIKVPEHLADDPDDAELGLPRSAALILAERILNIWEVPQGDIEAFLTNIADEALSNVLVIHQLLQVLFPRNEPSKYVHTNNKNYDDRTTWQAIQNGESLKVRKYLEHKSLGGGW
ncbi:hypothetical protein [Zhongshania aliphaticivorans]|uniref:Uncharacterized protein n=1 Tax=Zhongshania aliphaticivorans TaxID=1470434 RepID=A0A127M212_9GAMM|nr:hypothetical protein [Zhongshania aliphaticivorans]AMO67266.1 hypothetical protein AZF00_02665 [Zhongshania aliphaticivorans]